MDSNIEWELSQAIKFLNQRNLPAAEIICRDVLDTAPDNIAALHILGVIAATVGTYDYAKLCFSKILGADPKNHTSRENLSTVKSELSQLEQRPQSVSSGPKYLLIKSWGQGFWSDVSQVLGALLLAEITGRIPVVHWGRNSLYGDGSDKNAFQNYFQAVSDTTLQDLIQLPDATCFPPKWNQSNLFEEDINKWSGPYSRMAALYFLARYESIAVCDFFTGIIDVAFWLAPDHEVYGKSIVEISRYVIEKYLRPSASLLAYCQRFRHDHFAGRGFVACHIRGTDKRIEDSNLDQKNEAILEKLKTLAANKEIFLMTDDESWVTRVRNNCGNRVTTTVSHRSTGSTRVHLLGHDDPVRLGLEVMTDVFIALHADKFIGYGFSNVSNFVFLLKNWSDENCLLLGEPIFERRQRGFYGNLPG